jgi:hypothetical protein
MVAILTDIRKADLRTCQTTIDTDTAFELTSCLEIPGRIGVPEAAPSNYRLKVLWWTTLKEYRSKMPSIGLELTFWTALSAEVEDN